MLTMFELPMLNMMKLDVLKYNDEFYMPDSRERKRTISVIIRKRAVMKKKHVWSQTVTHSGRAEN